MDRNGRLAQGLCFGLKSVRWLAQMRLFFKHLWNLVKEILAFSLQHKKWWMFPVLLMFLMIALLVVVGQSTAPFIYTLF